MTELKKIKLDYDGIIRRLERIDHLVEMFKGNEEEYFELINKGIIIACRMAKAKMGNQGVKISGGGGANYKYTVYCVNDSLWYTSIGEVEIDFENKDFHVRLWEWTKDEFLKSAHVKGVRYTKEVRLDELEKWKKECTLVECELTTRINNLGENMKRVALKSDIEKLLLNKKFTMYNEKNDYKGEVTTLDKKDVRDIIYDRALVVTDGEKVIVDYPYNICKMVSL